MAEWYRYEDRLYASGVDECGDPLGPGEVRVHLRKYRVVRETPKGVWLAVCPPFSDKRFVRTDARRRFACPTVEEAKASFIARKNRQASIYQTRRERAEEAIRIVKGRAFGAGLE